MYNMKYVVHLGPLADEIYLFPNFVQHADFVSSMGFDRENVVQAGFVSPDLECYGDSISLKLKSDPAGDTALLHRTLRIGVLD